MAGSLLAALVSLDGAGHYFHWHWIDISYANLTVIALMVVTFVAALFVPFPGRRSKKETK
ncbi:MAG TPA: hypothetical protein PLS29_06815 [Acidimicrobiales bacterium]|nr:hypothetical protein [Acidimicrobiales bacterium]